MRVTTAAALLLLVCVASASAQTPSGTTDNLTLRQTIITLTRPAGSLPVGEAISFATSLEVSTAPFSTSTAGFVFKVDPVTGLKVRQATTFGPSFAERALTSGEGKIAVGVNLTSTTYDKLGDLHMDMMQLGAVNAPNPTVARKGIASIILSTDTLVISGAMGVTDKLDLGVAVPLVQVRLKGNSWVQDGNGVVTLFAKGGGNSSGVGDIAVNGKFRLKAFGAGPPDPGGFSLFAQMRLPTGDPENFRGLGVARTLAALVYSSGKGRIRPHANAGFEYWSHGVDVITDFSANPTTVTARHQVVYAGGVEFEATPKLTVLADLLGRHILGAGQVDTRTTPAAAGNPFGATSFQSLVAIPEGIRKLTLVPGLKLNLKGNLLLSLNGLTALHDNGLHATFTPVVGMDLTF